MPSECPPSPHPPEMTIKKTSQVNNFYFSTDKLKLHLFVALRYYTV